MTRVYLPAPVVHEAQDRCPSCTGHGVTGEQYAMRAGEQTIVVDVLCPACDGCGRDERHAGCDPMQHADWRRGDCYEEEVDERACPSCYGRQWNAVLGFGDGPGLTAQEAMYHLRVPCGCAEALMVTLDDPEDLEQVTQ